MRRFRGYTEVEEPAGAEVLEQVLGQRRRLEDRLAGVRHIVVVASGKGGVGKSAVTANLAVMLATRGHRVGAVDADLNGPSLARMLAAPDSPLAVTASGVEPAGGLAGVRLVSMDLLLAEADAPVRWRGPSMDSYLWRGALETGAVREFLSDIAWGELDFLLVDLPPGTDRIERLIDLVPRPAALLLVTTPSAATRHVVSKSARLVAELGVPRVGIVVNMSAYRCPCCGCDAPLFDADPDLVQESVDPPRVWAQIPFDPRLGSATDAGRVVAELAGASPALAAIGLLADRVERECDP